MLQCILMLLKKPSHVIIGIHGLNNKAPKRLLRKWWLAAIKEGAQHTGQGLSPFRFEMVYWANHLYPKPLNPREIRTGHPLFLSKPYIPASNTQASSKEQAGRSFLSKLFIRVVDRLLTRKSDDSESLGREIPVLEQMFPDLALYYENKKVLSFRYGIKDLLRRELRKTLFKYRGSQIMLIAHSMGSIIALDVLKENQDIHVDHLITLGSPLGFPIIRKQYAKENGMDLGEMPLIPAPDTIRRKWANIGDRQDIITWFNPLGDHYSANSHGVSVNDIEVSNDYVLDGATHHHSIFGYLRAQQTAEIITDFSRS